MITFDYDGGRRTVEPHCHGVSTAGNEVLRGYQTDGHSRSGRSIDWKLFDVSKMLLVHVTEETFPTNRPDYNPRDQHMDVVHCHV